MYSVLLLINMWIPQFLLYYYILYCTVLYCTVLYCTVLYCTVLYCTVLCHRVLVGLEVCAGVGGAALPVVEGGDGPGWSSEVLQTAGGGQSLGGALDHRDQNVPLSCKSTRQDKPRRGI